MTKFLLSDRHLLIAAMVFKNQFHFPYISGKLLNALYIEI